MFGKKRIEELEYIIMEKNMAIEHLCNDKKHLQEEIKRRDEAIGEIQHLLERTPEDCKVGEWCRSCEFGKQYPIVSNSGMLLRSITFCGRAEACKNFVCAGGKDDGTR